MCPAEPLSSDSADSAGTARSVGTVGTVREGLAPSSTCADRRPGPDGGRRPVPVSTRLLGVAIGAGLPLTFLLPVPSALAQSASPGATIELAPVIVRGTNRIDERFASTPGAVSRIDRSEPPAAEVAPTLSESLSLAPGVVIQEFFGGNDQPRIQIRGAGLQQNPAERGLVVLQDGMPVNRADGSYIVGLAVPGQAQSIEVFRGAAANRLGANVLGGAVNFLSASGASAPGGRVALGVGSFARRDLAVRHGVDGERIDGLLQFEHAGQDGFRDYNESSRTSFGGNLSLSTGPANTRLFLSHTDLDFDVAGPLTWSALRADSRRHHGGPVVVNGSATQPGPNVLRDRPYRKATQTLAGVRTTVEEGANLYDAAFSLSRTDDSFAFPISAGFRDTEGSDATLSLRYARLGADVLPAFETGLSYSVGSADREYFHNLAGARGPGFGRNRLRADTLSLFAGGRIPIGAFSLSPQLAWMHAGRDNRDRWAAATRPTVAWNPMNPLVAVPAGAVPSAANGYDRDYSGLSPSLALSWAPARGQFGWISLARSHEAPTHDDLIGTLNGTPNSGPGRPAPGNPALAAALFATPNLKAQRADTVEVGWRGTGTGFQWEATAYHSRLDHELLSLRDASGATLASVNADKTRHSGLEVGVGWAVTRDVDARLAWTWQDFRFDNDPLRGNNRIAGAPRHLVNLGLDWRATGRLTLNGLVRWVPGRTPVDNMNTVYNPAHVVAGLGADYAVSGDWTVFARVSNLFDKRYAASTLTLDQATAQQAAYLPGQGRAGYVGARLRF